VDTLSDSDRLRYCSNPVDLKIQWANRHRESLFGKLEAYRRSEPYQVRIDHREWQGNVYRVAVAHDVQPPPAEVALVFGDLIENLRSSLDYLVGLMRKDGPSQNSGFPICRQADGDNGFFRLAKRKLADIPEEAKDLIEGMQPYDSRGDALDASRYRSLAALQALWNISKHRTVLFSTAINIPDYVVSDRADEDGPGIGHRIDPAKGEAEWWLPLSGEQTFDPHFGVKVSLAKPRGFAEDLPDWVAEWTFEGLVSYIYKTVEYDVVSYLYRFIQPVTP
jgi:hypothetical protein